MQGSYGRVYLARLHETPCAVKVLLSWQEDGAGGTGGTGGNGGNGAAVGANGGNAATAAATMEQRQTLTLSSPLLADLRREAGVMAALHHPNCVQLMGICADPAAIVTGARCAGMGVCWTGLQAAGEHGMQCRGRRPGVTAFGLVHPTRHGLLGMGPAASQPFCPSATALQSTVPEARSTMCCLPLGATRRPPAS